MSTSDEESLDRLGRLVTSAQRGALEDAATLARTRWSRGRLRTRRVAYAGGALALAAAVGLVVTLRPAPPLGATLDGQALEDARWVFTEAPSEIAFSDGTRLHVDADTVLRLRERGAHGAVVDLASGRLVATVHHAPQTQWTFHVGPYDVRVTGTEFETSWQAAHERFEIRMRSGSVIVRGPRLSGSTTLVGGESLVAAPTSDPTEPPPPSAASEATADGYDDDDRTEVHEDDTEPAELGPRARATEGGTSRERDRAFLDPAADGDFAGALAIAEARGFERLCERLDEASLLRLGDVARYAGDRARARSAYLALRRRFPSSARAADAAYALGLCAASPREAARHFETYLAESPRGPLAREARGRLVESYHRAGAEAEARRGAEDYLAHHPDGPHAELARSLTRP